MTQERRREGVFRGLVTVIALAAMLILKHLLVGEPELTKEGQETRIAPDGVVEAVQAGEDQEGLLLLSSHLQVAESVVSISQSYVENGKALRRDELPLGLREQLLENPARLGGVPVTGMNVTDTGEPL